ncbi:MAG: hypothetical protein OER88_08280 [Planctomycetota bacterium]|nr:hypothetical protein [Planctomycetota bacterium]
MRIHHLLLLPLIAALAAAAPPENQVNWVGDWDKAFAEAKATGKPVMICINSKDGESANERTAKTVYRSTNFVLLSRKLVMMVLSVRSHALSGTCPRFGKVTCRQHLQCWKELSTQHGDTFRASSMSAEMISPQHAWFRPDGTLLWRLEYETRPASGFKGELMTRMNKALKAAAEKKAVPESGTPESRDDTPAPTIDKDKMTPELERELERAQSADEASRRAALANLLSAENKAATAAVMKLLADTKSIELKCDVLRALGKAMVTDAREPAEAELKHKDGLVRSFAAVCLEALGAVESVKPLLKQAKRERDRDGLKNMMRALGACGGPAANEDVAKYLLKAVTSAKQNAHKKHAALSLKHYGTDEGKKLVVKKLERLAAKTKAYETRGGLIYTLAHIGNVETTLPVFEKIKDDVKNSRWALGFVRQAIRRLKGEASDFGRSGRFLYAEDRDDPARSDN